MSPNQDLVILPDFQNDILQFYLFYFLEKKKKNVITLAI